MVSESDIRHLTEYDLDEGTESYEENPPEDGVAFDLYYNGSEVNPWAKGPHELVRLYFNEDRLSDYYIPITYAEQIEEGVRLTPIGKPIGDDVDGAFDETDATVLPEERATIDAAEFDLLWYSDDGDTENKQVIVATDFGRAEE